MIHVTEKASQVLLDALEATTDDEAGGIRLTYTPEGGYGFGLDVEHEGDQVVEREGRKVLLVDEAVGEELEGATLDVVRDAERPRFTIRESE